MKLIIESGATKSDWRIMDDRGKETETILAGGMNVSTMSMESVRAVILDTASGTATPKADLRNVHLYIAGVLTDDIVHNLNDIFNGIFPHAELEIQDDLTAAARAVCGHRPGIAAILGTGSNSCQFDGKEIVRRVYSSGYILGDEGSAATLGKLFLSDYLKGLVPETVSKEFASKFDGTYAGIIGNVYRSVSPSAYLGSLAPFITSHYDEPYIKELVDGNFRAFFRRSIKQYDFKNHPVGIVGGFGYAMRDIVLRIAEEEGVSISGFIREPVEGLQRYHSL